MDELCGAASVVLASRDDETLLHGPTPAESSLRWRIGLGASEVILRDGPGGAYVGIWPLTV
jgi:hypothetical protein